MPINAELQKWLAEKAIPALSPEEQQVFNSILAKEAVAEQLNRAWMAPPDYNRKMNELKDKETQMERELLTHQNSLKTYYENWREQENARVRSEQEAQWAAYQRDVAALRAQVEAEGLQPTVATPVKPAANGNGTAPVTTNGQYMTKQQFDAELSKAAMYPALVAQVVEQHRQLFGNAPDMPKITETALRTGRALTDVWRETYKVAEKETEIQQAAIQKQIEDGVQARLVQLQSDGAMSQQNFSGRQPDPSPIKQMIAAQRQAEANSPLATPQPVMQESSAVREAVSLLNSGRFAVKLPGQ